MCTAILSGGNMRTAILSAERTCTGFNQNMRKHETSSVDIRVYFSSISITEIEAFAF